MTFGPGSFNLQILRKRSNSEKNSKTGNKRGENLPFTSAEVMGGSFFFNFFPLEGFLLDLLEVERVRDLDAEEVEGAKKEPSSDSGVSFEEEVEVDERFPVSDPGVTSPSVTLDEVEAAGRFLPLEPKVETPAADLGVDTTVGPLPSSDRREESPEVEEDVDAGVAKLSHPDNTKGKIKATFTLYEKSKGLLTRNSGITRRGRTGRTVGSLLNSGTSLTG